MGLEHTDVHSLLVHDNPPYKCRLVCSPRRWGTTKNKPVVCRLASPKLGRFGDFFRPERPERAYMDILKNIQRTHEVLTPAVH